MSVFIAQVLNSAFRYGKVPEMFKMGYITPIYKKQGKPLFDPNSYRRITITSLIGKVLEKYLLESAFSEFEALQNPLQKGFTLLHYCLQRLLLKPETQKLHCMPLALMPPRPLMLCGTSHF